LSRKDRYSISNFQLTLGFFNLTENDSSKTIWIFLKYWQIFHYLPIKIEKKEVKGNTKSKFATDLTFFRILNG